MGQPPAAQAAQLLVAQVMESVRFVPQSATQAARLCLVAEVAEVAEVAAA
jgi:hypothetical protein